MKAIILFLFTFLITIAPEPVQDKSPAEIHSAMVYNFMKYVNWSDENISGEFIIAVYGSDEVYNTLNQWYNDKPKGGKKIKVKNIKNISEFATAHVLYISKTKNKEFDAIHTIIKGKPVLSITDSNNLGQKGAAINMKVIDGKLKFEINQKTFEESGLRVSSQLTAMAIMI